MIDRVFNKYFKYFKNKFIYFINILLVKKKKIGEIFYKITKHWTKLGLSRSV